MYENNKDIGWKKKNNNSNGSYDDSLIRNQINILDNKIDEEIEEVNSQLAHIENDYKLQKNSFLNMLEFGCDNTGKNPIDKKLKEALESEYSTLYFPNGIYLLTKGAFKSNKHIIGESPQGTQILIQSSDNIDYLFDFNNKSCSKMQFKNNSNSTVLVGGNIFSGAITHEECVYYNFTDFSIRSSNNGLYYSTFKNIGIFQNGGEGYVSNYGVDLSSTNLKPNANTFISVASTGISRKHFNINGNANTFIGCDASFSGDVEGVEQVGVYFDGNAYGNTFTNLYFENLTNINQQKMVVFNTNTASNGIESSPAIDKHNFNDVCLDYGVNNKLICNGMSYNYFATYTMPGTQNLFTDIELTVGNSYYNDGCTINRYDDGFLVSQNPGQYPIMTTSTKDSNGFSIMRVESETQLCGISYKVFLEKIGVDISKKRKLIFGCYMRGDVTSTTSGDKVYPSIRLGSFASNSAKSSTEWTKVIIEWAPSFNTDNSITILFLPTNNNPTQTKGWYEFTRPFLYLSDGEVDYIKPITFN